jgi:hypothetical protein
MKPNRLLIALLAATGLSLPVCAQTAATDASPAATAAASAAAVPVKLHFGGTASSVDATTNTITVTNKKQGTKTFAVTPTTEVTKTDGTKITLADIKAGDHVHGSYDTTPDGKLEALTIKAGPKIPAK